jgi:signal transduction histidine kinase
MKPARTIRWYLFSLLVATALPLLSMLAYAIYSGADSTVSTAKSSARMLAKITASDTDRVLRTNREALERIARRPLIRTAALGHCDGFLDDFHDVFPMFANATVIDPEGIAICSAVPQPGGKPVFVGKAEWFQRAVTEQRFVVGRPFLGPITGRWVSVLISPVRNEMGDVSGYLGFPMDLAAYRPSVSNAVLPEGSTVGILDNEGTLIWRNIDPENWVGKNVSTNDATRKVASGEREFSGAGIDGIERVYFVERLAEADWNVYVGVPKRALYADAIQSVLRNSTAGVAFLAIVLVFAAGMARRITDPIRDLARTARRIKGGEVNQRVAPAGPRELIDVAMEFNAMVDVREAQNRILIEREESLRQSNIDLERFAYVASHDLQTPLRTISSFTQLLEHRYRGRLDVEADEFITYIVNGSQQMARLITDLLDYARVTSQGQPLTVVSVKGTVDEALASLKTAIAEAGADVSVANLPEALADARQLVRLFHNLIENALKYRDPNRPPKIVITAESHSDTRWRFAVADNGIGIESEYFDKIFEIFQRLKPMGDTEGTGIGLTLCQRIVHRFGGAIWVASTLGQGSTFFFTLPKTIGATAP